MARRRTRARRRSRAAPNQKTRRAQKAERWENVFYQEQDGTVPAKTFLDGCPDSVRQQLLATLVAVRDAPPPSFPASGLWHVMRDEMKGLHEARDKHEKRLYRLFCVLDRGNPDNGLDAPVLAILSGGEKAVGEAMDERIYQNVRRQRDEYLASVPRRIER